VDSKAKVDGKAVFMVVINRQLNRFERVLFSVALVLAVLLVGVRIAAVVVMWYLHHPR